MSFAKVSVAIGGCGVTGLTPRQRRLLDWLESHREGDWVFVYRLQDIAAGLGLKSKTTVFHSLQRLEERGFVCRWGTAIKLKTPKRTPVIINGEPYRFIPKSRAA